MSSRTRIERDGVNQLERLPESLGERFIKLDDRSLKDLFERAIELSEKFAFYDLTNSPNGNWQTLLPPLSALQNITEVLAKTGKTSPHVALLLAFIKLSHYAQEDLNAILSRHLDTFFKRVLGLNTQKPVADQVHVFFELKKNVPSIILDKNAKLDAGTTKKGKKIIFSTNKDIAISPAKIESIRSIFFDRDNSGKIYGAPVANSLDGLGKEFLTKNQTWPIFGPNEDNYSNELLTNLRNTVGFALSSPMFLLAGGTRELTIDFVYRADLNGPEAQSLDDQLVVEFSGEKGWFSPGSVKTALLFDPRTLLPNVSSPIRYENIDLVDFPAGIAEFYSPFSLSEEGNLQRTLTKVETEIETIGLQNNAIVTTTTTEEVLTPILRLGIILGEEDPSVVSPAEEIYPEGPKANWPVCRVILKTSEDKSAYSFLRSFLLREVNIKLIVKGLRTLHLENDQGVLNAENAFLPFGTAPSIGSTFYIGSEELVRKAISSFSVDLLWDQAPSADLGSHYFPYDDTAALAYANATTDKEAAGLVAFNAKLPTNLTSLNQAFNATFLFRLNNQWLTLTKPQNSLFGSDARGINAKGLPEYHQLTVSEEDLGEALASTGYGRMLTNQDFKLGARKSRQGFIGLSLRGPETPTRAFGHMDFSRATVAAAIHNANPANANNQKPLPLPPYLPTIKELRLNYVSSHTIPFNQTITGEEFFHIEPFGYFSPALNVSTTLFPNLRDKGNLFIGISGLNPPQQLSILFQLQEGSASPEETITSEEISWAYLAKNQWMNIPRQDILLETTHGFQTSGIVELLIPGEATPQNSRFLDDLFWLRVSTRDKVQGVSSAINLHTNAVAATRKLDPATEENNGQGALELLIPANQIKKLQSKQAEISKIHQPYASFGGRLPEQNDKFLSRVSERLRHRQRAVTYWDFERIVLEAFPSIFKVKCLPHTSSENASAPGAVSLIIISNLRSKNTSNPFQPKTSSITLSRVKDYLTNLVAPFVELSVENPIYEPMLLDLKVAFRKGFDPGFYGKQLNQEIKEYLSPWAFAEGEDIVFDGRIKRSAILGFIEERPYVDFVADFELYHLFDGPDPRPGIGEVCVGIDFIIRRGVDLGIGEMAVEDNFIVGEPEEEAIASTPRSVLVSAQDHRIRVLDTSGSICRGRISALGIGFMRIGGDFIVGAYDYAIGNAEIVPLAIGGNPAFTSSPVMPQDFRVFAESELPNNPN